MKGGFKTYTGWDPGSSALSSARAFNEMALCRDLDNITGKYLQQLQARKSQTMRNDFCTFCQHTMRACSNTAFKFVRGGSGSDVLLNVLGKPHLEFLQFVTYFFMDTQSNYEFCFLFLQLMRCRYGLNLCFITYARLVSSSRRYAFLNVDT